MKRLLEDNKGNILFTAMVVLVGVMLGFAVYGTFHGAEAVIGGIGNVTASDNPHNLSAGSDGVQATDEVRICIFCHASHNTITDADLLNAPLWNHSLSSAVYNVLTSGTVINSITHSKFSGFVANAGVVNMLSSPSASPDGASRLCLGCHDGTVAIGDVSSETVSISMDSSDPCVTSGGKLQSGCTSVTGAKPYIGNDLTSKHAVSIAMNVDLRDASNYNCGVAGQTTKVKFPWIGPDAQANVVILRPTANQYNGKPGISGTDASSGSGSNKYGTGYNYGVQCSTCHDPHDWSPVEDTQGYKFIVTDTFDELCKACHVNC
jgi:hypothetical protein